MANDPRAYRYGSSFTVLNSTAGSTLRRAFRCQECARTSCTSRSTPVECATCGGEMETAPSSMWREEEPAR